MKKFKVILSILLIFSLLTVGCSTQNSGQSKPADNSKPAANTNSSTQPATEQGKKRTEPYEIKMGSGPAGAVTDALYAAVFDDLFKANPYLKGGPTTGQTNANVIGVVQGKYNIGHSLTDITGAALDGQDFFKSSGPIKDVSNLVTWWPMTTTWVVFADSPYQSILDLKGKKVSPGPRGGSNDLETQRILEAMGLSYKDFNVQFLGFDDAEQQMMDGHLDGLLYSMTAYPHTGLLNIMSQKQVRFLPVPQDAIDKVVSTYKGLDKSVLPKGTYKLKDGSPSPEMAGVGGYIHWLVRNDFPEDVAYDMVKTITENFDRYQANFNNLKLMKKEDLSREVPGIPLHPGAKKYFEEVGFIKK